MCIEVIYMIVVWLPTSAQITLMQPTVLFIVLLCDIISLIIKP